MMRQGLLLLAALSLAGFARPSRAAEANHLTTAKIIYVEPMPSGLDQWIIQDLRAWGKYQISGSEQGVDLVIRSQKPAKKIHYTRHETPPVLHRQHTVPPVLSVTVVDWVTGAKLWQAQILNVGPKKDQKNVLGPETEIDARHMKPDEIAERCTNLLRRYVESLENTAAGSAQ